MKKARIINAAIWAAIGIALVVGVCVQWHSQGCSSESLTMAIVMYSAFAFCFWLLFDQTIKEKSKQIGL